MVAQLPAAVDGPLLLPPRLSLLTSALPANPTDFRWVNGITFEPESCGTDMVVVVACDDTPVTKPDSERPGPVTYEPFAVVAPDTCSTLGRRYEDARARAQRKLEACKSKQIEQELWTGTLIPTNMRLAENGVTEVLGAGQPATIADGIACIEQGLRDCGCGSQGMIHMTPKAATAAVAQNLLRREGGLLLTYLDTIVVPGSGYTGSSPTNPTGEPAEFAEWIYGTGMVKFWLGPMEFYPDNERDAVNRTTNTIEVRAEQAAAAVFDPCCLVGIEVDVPDCGASGS